MPCSHRYTSGSSVVIGFDPTRRDSTSTPGASPLRRSREFDSEGRELFDRGTPDSEDEVDLTSSPVFGSLESEIEEAPVSPPVTGAIRSVLAQRSSSGSADETANGMGQEGGTSAAHNDGALSTAEGTVKGSSSPTSLEGNPFLNLSDVSDRSGPAVVPTSPSSARDGSILLGNDGSVATSDGDGDAGGAAVDFALQRAVLDPHESLTLEQYDFVVKLPAAGDAEALSRFFQLLPYFGGRHSVDEMMWSENLSRVQVLEIFDLFRAVLHKVVC